MHTTLLHPYGKNMVRLRSVEILLCVLWATGCVSATSKFQNPFRSLSAANIFGIDSFLSSSSGNECTTENKNPGTCLTRVDCSKLDGVASGSCDHSGVCCEISMACGKVSRAKKTYIHNPSKIPSQCSYFFRPYSKNVCQLRIDFSLKLDKPSIPHSKKSHDYVQCDDSYMQVGSFKLCGHNKNQHFYVPFVAEKNENVELTLSFAHRESEKSGSDYWDIIVTQLECPTKSDDVDKDHSGWNWHLSKEKKTRYDTDLIAPEGCLQYYTAPSGIIESFNYNGGSGPYLGNMRYAICFKKDPSDEKIMFEGIKFNLNSNHYNRVDTNLNCYDSKNKHSNGDYLMIPDSYLKTPFGVHPKVEIEASKYCGSILEHREVYYAPAGPFIITVNFDKRYKPYKFIQERGFKIKYTIFSGSSSSDLIHISPDNDDDPNDGHYNPFESHHDSGLNDHYSSHYYPWANVYDYPSHLESGYDPDDDHSSSSSGGRPGGHRPGGIRPNGGPTSGSRPSGGTPNGGPTSGGRPGGGPTSGGRPGGDRPIGNRPGGNRLTDSSPGGGSPAFGNPGKPFQLFQNSDNFDLNAEPEFDSNEEAENDSGSSDEVGAHSLNDDDADNGDDGEKFRDNADDFRHDINNSKRKVSDALPKFKPVEADKLRQRIVYDDDDDETQS